MLRFVCHRADGLLGVDSGGTSDPFCVLTLLNAARDEIGKELKTGIMKKTLSPEWGESGLFDIDLGAAEAEGAVELGTFSGGGGGGMCACECAAAKRHTQHRHHHCTAVWQLLPLRRR